MSNSYSQEIITFSKINHKFYLAKAYASKDITEFCRQFCLIMMSRYNVVVCQTPITSVIHQLTGWEKEAIKRAIKRLENDGELKKKGHKAIIINDLIANRLPFVTNHNGYDGKQPEYSSDQLKMLAELDRIIPSHPNIDRKDYDMKQLLNKMDQMERNLNEKIDRQMEILEFLMSRAKGEDVEQAKTMLRLVKNGE